MFKIKYNAGSSMTYKEAARLAKEEADTVRAQGTGQKDMAFVETKEYVDEDKS